MFFLPYLRSVEKDKRRSLTCCYNHFLLTEKENKFINYKSKLIMKQVFIKDVQMDTQTAFMANGNINIYPCAWENEQAPITVGGEKRSFRGRITVGEDGETHVVPYNEGGAPRYEELYSTEHCRLLMTLGGSILEKWYFSGRMSMAEIGAARRRESKDISAWFRTGAGESRRMEARQRRLAARRRGGKEAAWKE